MKRKREGEAETTLKARPIYRREELLNVNIKLCLEFNSIFNAVYALDYGDLRLYRHAESIERIETLIEYNEFIHKLVQDTFYIDVEEIIIKFKQR
jgi:hypothetical protein